MKNLFTNTFFVLQIFIGLSVLAQPVTCPAPSAGSPNCYQTSRTPPAVPTTNPLWQWPPLPHQDCCNAIPLCNSVNEVSTGTLIPTGAPTGTPFYPGCVRDELPDAANTCFSNNEKGTLWYKFKIRPLPNGPKNFGAPAGKLRFRIIPQDAYDDPTFDPDAFDPGSAGIGNTDYDFLLFDVTSACTDGQQCALIKGSSSFGTPNSVIKSCNWTGVRGPTGLFEPGTGSENAVGPATRFNRPLNVKVGQVFMLAIDNFSTNDQGFTVDFRPNSSTQDDSTAVVTPPPVDDSIRIKSVTNPVCNEKEITINFSAPIRTDSVAASSFSVLGPNGPYILTPVGSSSDCFGVEDTSFTFSIQPNVPDTTLQLILLNEIKDICGNKVVIDTIPFRIPFPKEFRFGIVGKQPNCAITKMNIEFAKPVRCDSVKPQKFQIWQNGVQFGAVTNIVRANGKPCAGGAQDTLYTMTFSQAVVDTSTLKLVMVGIIRDSCQNEVTFDTLSFRINKFLKVLGIRDTVCPDSAVSLRAVLDSNFVNFDVNQLFKIKYTWRDLTTNDTLRNQFPFSFFTGTPVPTSQVDIKRDTTIARSITYRVYARNSLNGCVDSSDVPVLFSPYPRVETIENQFACFGEDLRIKPFINNGNLKDMEFSWSRVGTPNKVISTDSILALGALDSLLAYGLNQKYQARINFKKNLGGCKAAPLNFDLILGRKITPKIGLIPEDPLASIIPADFTFSNQSVFSPVKTTPFFKWNFGPGESTSYGYGNAFYTYNLQGKFFVKLTAYDTLFRTSSIFERVCTNSDSVLVEVQNLVPSLVTVNGDRKNDFLFVQGMRPNTFTMKLYNRWGKLVGEQDPLDAFEGWDPKDLGPGQYYYILTEKRSGKTIVSWLTVNRE